MNKFPQEARVVYTNRVGFSWTHEFQYVSPTFAGFSMSKNNYWKPTAEVIFAEDALNN